MTTLIKKKGFLGNDEATYPEVGSFVKLVNIKYRSVTVEASEWGVCEYVLGALKRPANHSPSILFRDFLSGVHHHHVDGHFAFHQFKA